MLCVGYAFVDSLLRYNLGHTICVGKWGGRVKIQAENYSTRDILKILREWIGLTQKEFWKTINRSERSIRSLESGNRHRTVDTLLHIVKTHNMKIVILKDTSNSK